MRLGILTGGGDCPGLNAVIRAVVRAAAFSDEQVEILGIEDGFDGLVGTSRIRGLPIQAVRGILNRGGTILDTTNRGNPFAYPKKQADGSVQMVDCSDESW